jgi:hypothetical protein
MLAAQDVIHRTELPIDDRPHGVDLTGDILHAAVRRPGAVDVWYLARHASQQHMRRGFQIVGTGQPIPCYLGRNARTAISSDGLLVWHVLENHCSHQNVIDTKEMGDQPGCGTGICYDCNATLKGDGGDGWIPL